MVVWSGKTVAVPLSPVLPIPGSIITDVAEVVVQSSVEPWPCWIDVGNVLRVTTGGPAVTMTVVTAVTVPPFPEAVRVYVVVIEGETSLEPFNVTVPIPWLMYTELALLVVQLKVALWFWRMEDGEALNVTTGFLGFTVIFTLAVR
jgi:hypothetical protein